MNTKIMKSKLFIKLIKPRGFGFKDFKKKVGHIDVLGDDEGLFQIVEGDNEVFRLKHDSTNNVNTKETLERAPVKHLVINIGGR